MNRIVFATLASMTILVTGSVVFAQNVGVIDMRKKLFKEIDVRADDMEDMARGKKAFDLAYVKAAFATIAQDAPKLLPLFPDDSKTGKTRALPRVWDEKARFDGLLDGLGKDALAANAAVKDEASFKAALPKVLGDCKSCHDDFRAKKR